MLFRSSAVPVAQKPVTTSCSATAAAPTNIDDYSTPNIIDSDEDAGPSKPESGADAKAPKATPTQEAPSYDAAPAPTPAPEVPSSEGGSRCRDGAVCVIVTEIETVVEYVTVTADYRKRAAEHIVRRRHARRHARR